MTSHFTASQLGGDFRTQWAILEFDHFTAVTTDKVVVMLMLKITLEFNRCPIPLHLPLNNPEIGKLGNVAVNRVMTHVGKSFAHEIINAGDFNKLMRRRAD